MLLRIQTKILVLVGVIAVSFLAGLVILQQSEQDRAELLQQNRKAEKQSLIEELIKLKGATQRTFAYDYSFWDDMVTFVQKRNLAWAHDNIDVSLQTYASSVAWVFRPDRSLVYAVALSVDTNLISDSFTIATITKRLETVSFAHFFVSTNCGLVEIRTAPIQPSSDLDRKTVAKGYLVIGKRWDEHFVSELAEASSCRIDIISPSGGPQEAQSPSAPGQISFAKPLWGTDDEPVALLQCSNTAPVYQELASITKRQLFFLAGFAIMIAALLLLSLSRWVNLPLKQISQSLEDDDLHPIEAMGSPSAEFAQIAGLMKQFFQQKRQLQDDITERAAITEALRESQRALETLMSNLPGMAYRCKNDPDWTMDFVSNGCFDVTGYKAHELINNSTISYGMIIHPDDQQMVWHEVQRAIVLHQPFRLNYRIIDAEGNVRWVIEHGRGVFSEHCDLVAIEGFILEITEKVRAEKDKEALQKQLERAQRMESLAILAGGVAHDLNNLLGPVVAYPDLILMKIPADSPIKHDVEMISQAAQQAVNVIQDLLSLARRGRYDMKPLGLNDVVEAYLKSASCVEQQERHRNVTLVPRLDTAISPILGSSTHLMKAVMNLIVNAFDAMHEGGTLTITTSQQHVSKLKGGFAQVEEGDYVLLSVADTGSGIDPNDLPKIFEPYYSKKAMGRSGTGLGLAVVYGIVKDHNGYYDIFSKVGVGTEFVLYFPVTREAISQDITSKVDYRGTERILVVDDIPEQRRLAQDILTAAGYTVDTVASGHEAVLYLKQHSADIVLLDMIMEKDFDGLDTYREICRVRPGQKALIVSGYSATERITAAQHLGAGQYVRKPYTRQVLCKAVREELNKSLYTTGVRS